MTKKPPKNDTYILKLESGAEITVTIKPKKCPPGWADGATSDHKVKPTRKQRKID